MTARTLVGALIGTGSIARQLHMPAHRQLRHSTLKWVCDANLETAKSFAEDYGIPRYTTLVDDVLTDEEVDWIDIATPNSTHEPIAVRCLEAGKHVLVQKPMASSADAAARMSAAAAKYDRKLGVFMFFRSDTGLDLLRKLVKGGHFGHIISMRGKMISGNGFSLSEGSWRMQEGCGALEQLGVHMIDLFLWLYGEMQWVTSYSATLYAPMEGDDVTTAIYGFSDGVTALLETTYCSFADSRSLKYTLEINGTEGYSHYDLTRAELKIHLKQNCQLGDFSYQKEEGPALHKFESAYQGGHRIHQAFVEAIRADKPFFIDGRAGGHVLKAVEATRKSAFEGRRIIL